MRGATLSPDCKLFPFGVVEVGISCIEGDLFGWVQYARKFDERFVPLPEGRAEAEEMLAARLLRDYGFTVPNAVEASKRLFAEAFKEAEAQGLEGDSLCEGQESIKA